MSIEKLFRISLIASFFMNMGGALTFVPVFRSLRELGGLPEAGNPFYQWILAIWIFFFGVLYLFLAFAKTREKFFVLIGALGKTSFAVLLAILAFAGNLPSRAALVGLGDLVVAVIFFVWILKSDDGK